MRVITNTNIIVDDFDYCKNYPKGTFIHFLTHYHADHYKGISPGWDYGPIYCSNITKNLILANFPNIPNIITAELHTKFTISLNKEGTKSVDVTFFDANHIPGSIMILFQGYMGTILHTGDMRFNESMISNNPILYPVEKRNKTNLKCSIQIDEVIFDNTYINPVHKFPDREKALQMLIDIIERNKDKYIIIAMGILGKERVALQLAKHFQTCILIPERKFNMMQAMGLPTDCMTTTRGGNWIEVIHKIHRVLRLEEEKRKGNKNFIMVSVEFTGFEVENLTAADGINYLVPYSQHSNYKELESFVKSICPSILKKLVVPYLDKPQFKNRSINNLAVYFSYIKNLSRGGKSAFTYFLKNYTDITTLSAEYKKWMTDEAQKHLMEELKIPIKVNTSLRRVANKKKKALEDELQLHTKKTVDINALENKIFHAHKRKRKSFAEITLHKAAINSSQNLDLIFSRMGGKKKVKTNIPAGVEKDLECKAKEQKIHLKFKNVVNVKHYQNSKDENKTRFDPSQDKDLLSFMEKFVSSNSHNQELEFVGGQIEN